MMTSARTRARNFGKSAELHLARAYGSERNLDQNRDGGDCDFFIVSRFGRLRAEVKARTKLPAWLETALEKGDIVFLHEKGAEYDHGAVLMRRDLLDKLLGVVQQETPEAE